MDLSGILSQAGFAFQMKVFLKQVTELNPNAVASYEYLMTSQLLPALMN